jgi:hypothetical protein
VKEFRILAMVRHPCTSVAPVVRDEMPALAVHLDDVESVTVEDRIDHADGQVDLVNLWRADVSVPTSVRRWVDRSMLAWTDTATWASDGLSCQWRIEPLFAADAVACHGTTTFEEAMGGRGTRITFAGQFDVVARRLPAGMLLGQVGRDAIAGFVAEVVPRSLHRVGAAVGAHLDAQ